MKNQMKAQKIVCYLVLISCALAFVFGVGLSTTAYHLYQAKAYGVESNDIFNKIQPFNKQLVSLIVVMIVTTLTLFITNTHKRRKYYISNFISTAITSIVCIVCSIIGLVGTLKFKTMFLTYTDFEAWKIADQKKGGILNYTESTFWFDINVFASIFVILTVLLLIGNMIWKIILMKEEKALLSGQRYITDMEE